MTARALAGDPRAAAEHVKIDWLLARIRTTDAVFIRNGKEYAGAPAAQLPALLPGPARLADRHLAADRGPGLARPGADQQRVSHRAGGRGGDAAVVAAVSSRRRPRRPLPAAAAPLLDAERGGSARSRLGGADARKDRHDPGDRRPRFSARRRQ